MAISDVKHDHKRLLQLSVLLVVLLGISGDQQDVKYIPLEGVLELLPDVTEPIIDILWKHDGNGVAEWDQHFGPDVDYNGTFKHRIALNKDTGELVINNVNIEDSGIYSVEINGRLQSTHNIKVIRHSLVKRVGHHAVLPCEVDPTTDPTIDLTDLTIEWSRPDLPGDPYVYYQRNGREILHVKDPSYMERTSLFQDEVKKGNMSLKLTRMKLSDEGIYICRVPEFNKESIVHLNSTAHLIVAPHIRAVEGEDVILPCQTDFTETTVRWTREDPTPHHVHAIRNDQELTVEKNSVYIEEFKDGDVSLRISGVTFSDEGLYTCYITSEKECVVQLTVVSLEDYSPVGPTPRKRWFIIIPIIIIIFISIMVINSRSIWTILRI